MTNPASDDDDLGDTPPPALTPEQAEAAKKAAAKAARDEKKNAVQKEISQEQGAALLKAYGIAHDNDMAAQEQAKETSEAKEKAAKAIVMAIGNREFMWRGAKWRGIERKDKGADTKSYYLKKVSAADDEIPSF